MNFHGLTAFILTVVCSTACFAQDVNKTIFKSGKPLRVGAWEWRDAQGRLVYQTTYSEAGLEEGTARQFGTKGQKIAEMTYVNGKLEGLATRWWPDGHLREQAVYQAGRLHGLRKRWTYEPGTRKACPDDLTEEELERIDVRQAAGHCCSSKDESCWAGAAECWLGGERRAFETCSALYASGRSERSPASAP